MGLRGEKAMHLLLIEFRILGTLLCPSREPRDSCGPTRSLVPVLNLKLCSIVSGLSIARTEVSV